MEALIDPAELLGPRRLGLLEHDLTLMGVAPSLATAPAIDLGFLDSEAAAWGSLYVVEGSSLGGQFISKALRGADWAPAEGLSYFNPYGRRTAAMWAGFRRTLEARGGDAALTVEGARATFAALAREATMKQEVVA